MSQSFIRSRPSVLTDERLKANREKLKKQRLLKEDLDKQIQEKKRLTEANSSSSSSNQRKIQSKAMSSPPSENVSTAHQNGVLESSPLISPLTDPLPVRYTISFEGGKTSFAQQHSGGNVPSSRNTAHVAKSEERGGGGSRAGRGGGLVGTPPYPQGGTPRAISSTSVPGNFTHGTPLMTGREDVRLMGNHEMGLLSPEPRPSATMHEEGRTKKNRVSTSREPGSYEVDDSNSPTVPPQAAGLFGSSGGASQRHGKTGAPKRPIARTLPPLEVDVNNVERALFNNKEGRESRSRQPSVASNPQGYQSKNGDGVNQSNRSEKEKGWEQQVKRLKEELRKARRHEKENNSIPRPRNPVAQRRAETAPEEVELGKRDPSLFPNRARYGNGGRRAPLSHANPEFSRARIFTADNFRRVESPPLEDMSINHELTVDEPMFGFTFDGRQKINNQQDNDSAELDFSRSQQSEVISSVPIAYAHLEQFAKEQIITEQQATKLWSFFLDSHEVENTEQLDISIDVGEEEDLPLNELKEDYDQGTLLQSSSTFDYANQVERVQIPLRIEEKEKYLAESTLYSSSGEPEEVLSTRKPLLAESLRKKIINSRQNYDTPPSAESRQRSQKTSSSGCQSNRNNIYDEKDFSQVPPLIEALLESSDEESIAS